MPTIDELQIEISASSRLAESSIDKLERSLLRLRGTLNLDFGGSLSTSLSNLNTNLSALKDTINSFDSGKLKGIAGSFRSLSRITTVTTNASKSVNQNLRNISSSASQFTDKIAKAFNITDTKGIQALNSKLMELEGNIRDGVDTNATERAIEGIVKEYGAFAEYSKQAKDAFLDFKNAIREAGGFNLKELGESWNKEFSDPNRMRGIFGIGNTTNTTKQTVDEFVKQFNAAYQGSPFSVGENESNVNVLQRMLKTYDMLESDARTMADLEYKSAGAAEHLGSIMSQVKEHIRGAANESETLNQALQSMPNVSDKILPTNNSDALESIILNLKELSSLNLSAENMGGLNTIANAMGKLGGKSASGASQYISQIAEGLKELPHSVPTGENYAQLAAGLAKLGGVKVQNAAGLKEVAKGLNALKGIGSIPNIEGLTELGQALSVFGRKTAQNAVTVIPQIATAFRQLIQTLSTASNISREVIDLANAMANLTANTNRASGAASRQIPLLSRLGSTSKGVAKSHKSLASVIGKVYATYWLLFRALGKVRQAIDYASSLVEVQNVVDTVFGDAKNKVEEFADTAITSFGLSELSAKQFASRYQAMGSAMGITNAEVVKANAFLDKSLEGSKRKLDGVADSYENLGDSLADMSINVAKLTADVGSFYNMDYEEVAQKMTAIWTGQTRPMREFGVDLTQATLQEWMLSNGIDGNIKKMTQAQKTMIRYQYVMAQLGHTMNDYARTADTWANVTRTIGEQFKKLGSIIGTGFINAFRPMLVRFRDFMNTLIDLVEKGLNAIGKLLGWQIEISEVGLADDAEYAEDLADGIGDAADNAKALNHQLQGFDKLNNLTTPSDKGGGGGGGGATGGGGGGASKTTDPTVTWKKYESDIATWWELGDTIADTLATAMENIDWESIYKKADNFGRGLAQFMNGLFADSNGTRLFEGVGTTIAGALNTVMTAADTWARYLEWGKIGDNIRKGFVAFLTEWKPEITGSAVGGIVGGLANAVYAMVSDKNTWTLLGTKISEGINAFLSTMGRVDKKTGLNGWEALGGSIASVFSGIGETVKTTLSNIDWNKAFKGLWEGLKSFIDNLTPEGVIAMIGLATLSKLPTLIKAALGSQMGSKITLGVTVGIAAALGAVTFINTDDSDILGKAVSALVAVGGSFLATTVLGGSTALSLTVAGVVGIGISAIDFFQAKKDDLKTKLLDAVAIGISAAFVTKSPYGLLATIPFAVKAVWDWGTSDSGEKDSVWGTAKSNFKKAWDDFWHWLNYDLFGHDTEIVGFDGKKLTITIPFTISWKSAWDEVNWDNVFDFSITKNLIERIKTHFENAISGGDLGYIGEEIIAGILEGLAVPFSFLLEPIYKVFTNIVEGFCKAFGIQSPAKEMKPIGKNIILGILEGFPLANIKKKIDEIKDKIVNHFSDIKEKVKKRGSEIVEGLTNGIKEKWSEFKTDLDTKKKSIIDKFNDIKDKFNAKGKDIVDGLKQGIKEKWSDFQTDFDTKKKGLIDKYNDIKDKFATKGSAIVTGLKTGFNDKWSDFKTWFADKKQWMIDKYNDINEKFTTKGNNIVSGLKSGISDKWSEFKSWFTDKKNNLVDVYENIKDKFSTKGGLIVTGLKSGISDKWTDLKSWFTTKRDNLADLFKTEKFETWGRNIVNGIKTGVESIWSKLTNIADDVTDLFKVDVEVKEPKVTKPKTPKKALGGAFYNERWHNIAQFASGGRPSHGTAFIAGEAGAEVVGHIGGRTEVLNESQMASVMYDAVSSAMAEQNAILIKQNQYLAGILAKDYGISSSDIFSATQREANNYQLRTGRPAFGY